MRYLVVGGSGTGGALGGFLVKGGLDVTFMIRGENLKTIKETGLMIHSDIKGEIKLDNIKIYTEEENIKYDVIFVCVKDYSLFFVTADIKRSSNENTIIIPILNVFGLGEGFKNKLPNLNVLEGCVYLFAYLEKYGEVVQSSDIFKIVFDGFNVTPRINKIIRNIKDDLEKCGIETVITEDIKRESFKNYCFNAAYSTAAVYFNSKSGFLKLEGLGRELFTVLSEEVKQLANPMGIELDVDIVKENIRILDSLDRKAYTALQKDIADGKRNEMEGMIFNIERLAEENGVNVPNFRNIIFQLRSKKGDYYVKDNEFYEDL